MSAAPKPKSELALLPADLPLPSNNPISIAWMEKDLAASGLTTQDIHAYPVEPVGWTCGAYVMWSPVPRLDRGPLGGHLTNWKIRKNDPEKRYSAPAIRYGAGPVELWNFEAPLPDETLHIYEGYKKAAAARKRWATMDIAAMDSCWGLVDKDAEGKWHLKPSFLARLEGKKTVVINFDGDLSENTQIQVAAKITANLLGNIGYRFKLQCVPNKGKIDDLLAANPELGYADGHMEVDLLELHGPQPRTLYTKLGCAMRKTSEGLKIIANELNAMKLLDHHFKDRVVYDQYFGYSLEGLPVTYEALQTESWMFLQEYCSPVWPLTAATTGFNTVKFKQTNALKDLTNNWDGVDRLYDKDGKPLVEAPHAERLGLTGRDFLVGGEFFKTTNPTTVYAEECFRIFLTGVAFRIDQPGCQFDTMLNLQSDQGVGKTTFYENFATFSNPLTGEPKALYYAPGAIVRDDGGLGWSKFARSCANALVVNLSEGLAVSRTKFGNATFKSFVTLKALNFREPYARASITVPVGYAIASDSNDSAEITDPSGSRRDLILKLSGIKHVPYDQKLQLIAEVRHKRSLIMGTEWWRDKADPAVDLASDLGQDIAEGMTAQEAMVVNQSVHASWDDVVLRCIAGRSVGGKWAEGLPIANRKGQWGFLLNAAVFSAVAQKTGLKSDNYTEAAANQALKAMEKSRALPFSVLPTDRVGVGRVLYGNREDDFLPIKSMTQVRGYLVVPNAKATLFMADALPDLPLDVDVEGVWEQIVAAAQFPLANYKLHERSVTGDMLSWKSWIVDLARAERVRWEAMSHKD